MRKLFISLVSIAVLVLSLLIAISREYNTDGKKLVVTLEEGNVISKLDLSTMQSQKVYKSDKYWVHSLTVSPNNKYIAFIEEAQPKYKRDGYEIPPQYNLVILDASGNMINHIDADIKKYSWNPNGEKIAYLTFAPCDPDYQYKCPTGAWVFDIGTDKKTKVIDRAYEMNWAIFDSAVYLYDHKKVIRWNSLLDKLDTTDYKDIYFSPDGKYYLHFPKYEESFPVQLYLAETNKNVSNKLPEDLGNLIGWVYRSGHFLLFTKAEVTTKTEGEGPIKVIKSREIKNVTHSIYDPDNRRILKKFDGSISSWISDGCQIIVEEKEKVRFEEIP